MTKTWIIKNAHTILTMDDTRRELNGHDILLRDGVIAEIGENLSIPLGLCHFECCHKKGLKRFSRGASN